MYDQIKKLIFEGRSIDHNRKSIFDRNYWLLATTRSHLDPWLWCYWLPDVDINQPGLCSSSITGLLMANTREWWGLVLGAVWQRLLAASATPALTPSCGALSERLKAATWSHPSTLHSIIGTKVSSVRGCSPIYCRVVITSSKYHWNAIYSNRVCLASSSNPLLLQLAHLGLFTSLYASNTPWPDITWLRKISICPWSVSNLTSMLVLIDAVIGSRF